MAMASEVIEVETVFTMVYKLKIFIYTIIIAWIMLLHFSYSVINNLLLAALYIYPKHSILQQIKKDSEEQHI
jgi:hypothetical protein